MGDASEKDNEYWSSGFGASHGWENTEGKLIGVFGQEKLSSNGPTNSTIMVAWRGATKEGLNTEREHLLKLEKSHRLGKSKRGICGKKMLSTDQHPAY